MNTSTSEVPVHFEPAFDKQTMKAMMGSTLKNADTGSLCINLAFAALAQSSDDLRESLQDEDSVKTLMELVETMHNSITRTETQLAGLKAAKARMVLILDEYFESSEEAQS